MASLSNSDGLGSHSNILASLKFLNSLQIREVIQAQGIRIYTPPIDDEENAEPARNLVEAMPFSIIGSTEDVRTPDGRVVKGREYIWGVAEGP